MSSFSRSIRSKKNKKQFLFCIENNQIKKKERRKGERMNKHSVSHKIHGKQIFIKDRDEERQQKEQNITIRTGASSVDANRSHFSLSLSAQYIIFSLFLPMCVCGRVLVSSTAQSLETLFSFTCFVLTRTRGDNTQPKRGCLSIMRLFFKKKLGSFFKNKKNEAWTKLLR